MTTYAIKGFCCSTGNCVTCRAGFDRNRRIVGIIGRTESLERAERIAKNWASLGAFVVVEGDARLSQQCRLFDHQGCPRETTLGTSPCECTCHDEAAS